MIIKQDRNKILGMFESNASYFCLIILDLESNHQCAIGIICNQCLLMHRINNSGVVQIPCLSIPMSVKCVSVDVVFV